MPDTRTHRGAHPEDFELFADPHVPALRAAAAELNWLLDRGYALRSSLALTGDRHSLTQRQRLAVARCACARTQLERRVAHQLDRAALDGRELWIDGYNVLITVESALAGSVLPLGRDGCFRDMASLHGSYREVAETNSAAELIGGAAAQCGVTKCHWLLDRPVGNSGRLKSLLLHIAENSGWSWEVSLEFNPDRILSQATEVVASSDSLVLNRCEAWCNFTRAVIEQSVPRAFVVDLSGARESR